MAESLLHAAGLSWHSGGDVTVSVAWGGTTYLVHVPVSSVRFEIRKAAAEVGLIELNSVGDLELVGWFGSKIWKKAKKAVKSVSKSVSSVSRSVYRQAKTVAKKAVKGIKKAANAGHALWRSTYKYAGKALNSKAFGTLVTASALVCPAIGGPALGAYMAAKGVQASVSAGGAVAKIAVENVKRLASGRYPTLPQKLLVSALKSYSADAMSASPAGSYYSAAKSVQSSVQSGRDVARRVRR